MVEPGHKRDWLRGHVWVWKRTTGASDFNKFSCAYEPAAASKASETAASTSGRPGRGIHHKCFQFHGVKLENNHRVCFKFRQHPDVDRRNNRPILGGCRRSWGCGRWNGRGCGRKHPAVGRTERHSICGQTWSWWLRRRRHVCCSRRESTAGRRRWWMVDSGHGRDCIRSRHQRNKCFQRFRNRHGHTTRVCERMAVFRRILLSRHNRRRLSMWKVHV